MLFAGALPFELKTPIVSPGPIAITNLEAILYILIVLWILGVLQQRRLRWTVMHSAVLVWVIVQFLSALLAPVEREAAVKFALRGAGGALLFFIAAGISPGRRVAWIMSAVACGAIVSALAGWLELESSAAQRALLAFKTQAALVGGQVRASGTFQYANTAAMYWEASLPILIAVGVCWSLERAQLLARAERRWLIAVLIGSVIVCEAIILSSSRGATAGAALALTIMIAADRGSSIRSGAARPAAFALIALLMLIGVQLILNPLLAVRLQSESDDSWFRASIQPAQSRLRAPAGGTISQTVVIANSGMRVWPAGGMRPIRLSYHWIQTPTRRVLILDGARTPLPHDVEPGEIVTVTALVQVPALTGTLTLQWDMVQEEVTWFSARGSPVAEVSANITSAQPVEGLAPLPRLPRLGSAIAPPRAELWRAGLKMWLDYPLLGLGPDNFRHVYGRYLGQAEFDDRITANNWVVEALATTGAIGLFAGFVVTGVLVLMARRQWRMLTRRSTRALALGLSVALLTFFAHGLVDYFMEFTPTYSLFWLTAGLLTGLLTGAADDEAARTVDRV